MTFVPYWSESPHVPVEVLLHGGPLDGQKWILHWRNGRWQIPESGYPDAVYVARGEPITSAGYHMVYADHVEPTTSTSTDTSAY